MTRNRDKLRSMAVYDLLCMMQRNLDDVEAEPNVCVMDALGVHEACRENYCEECIAKYLNERSDKGC